MNEEQAAGGEFLTITTDREGRCVLVSWQDEEHRILRIVWEAEGPYGAHETIRAPSSIASTPQPGEREPVATPPDSPYPYCLLCEKPGHATSDCWSTHALNSPRDHELFRLVRAATPPPVPSGAGLPEGQQWFTRKEVKDILAAAPTQPSEAPLSLPESMSKDEALKYYSDYANLCAAEALRYQKRIRELEATQPSEAAQGVAKWLFDPTDIEQGAILNPAWLKAHGKTTEPRVRETDSTGAMCAAWFGTPGAAKAIDAVFGQRLYQSEAELLEKTALAVGMKSMLNHGAGSCVWSEGCNGVTQDHLLAFMREVALHCAAALSAERSPEPDDSAESLAATIDRLADEPAAEAPKVEAREALKGAAELNRYLSLVLTEGTANERTVARTALFILEAAAIEASTTKGKQQ